MMGNNTSYATQQENIKEGNLYFPKYISFSPCSVDTIQKFELIGKILLYITSQGYLTPYLKNVYVNNFFLVSVIEAK